MIYSESGFEIFFIELTLTLAGAFGNSHSVVVMLAKRDMSARRMHGTPSIPYNKRICQIDRNAFPQFRQDLAFLGLLVRQFRHVRYSGVARTAEPE